MRVIGAYPIALARWPWLGSDTRGASVARMTLGLVFLSGLGLAALWVVFA